MSLSEPLNLQPISDMESAVISTPKPSFLTRHARPIIASLSIFSSFLIAALSCLLFLYLSTSSSSSSDDTPKPPFMTTGNPHKIGLPPPPIPDYLGRESVMARIGRDLDWSRDLTADPCDNFYQYACGGWVNKSVIPAGRTMITKGFEIASAQNAQTIQEVIDADWPIVTPMFQSCMDVAAVKALGYQPAKWFMDDLNPINHTLSRDQVFRYMGFLRQQLRLTSIFSMAVTVNNSDHRQPILSMGLGGLTFAAPTYYIGPNNISVRISQGISAMLQLAGDKKENADPWSKIIVAFETGLVRVIYGLKMEEESREWTEDQWVEHKMKEEKEALAAANNYYGLDELAQLMPNTPVRQFLDGTGLPQILQKANVRGYAQLTPNNATFVALDAFLKTVDPITLQLYARWHALNVSATYLAPAFQETHLQHFGSIEGLEQLPPRYAQCQNMVINQLADIFGRYYMARRLQPEMQQQARSLITWIRQAFERNLPSVSWMDDKTRAVALDKANAVLELVGGPQNSNWSDYSEVTIRRGRYYDNWYQIQSLRVLEDWGQLTEPVRRDRWITIPAIVNAFYYARANTMTFPAGILVDPFFNYDYPMSMNLGTIGMVMGHELLHGFDNNGRQYDKDGYLRQWWDDNVITAFTRKTKCIIDQYNQVTVQGSKLNGVRELGENIADNGGLHMAFLAYTWYKEQLAQYGLEDPVPVAPSGNSLTSDQLFYWSHAQTWCTKATDAAIRNQVASDAHAPGEARVWVPVVNQEGFAKAYNCPVGSRMNPPLDRKCDLY